MFVDGNEKYRIDNTLFNETMKYVDYNYNQYNQIARTIYILFEKYFSKNKFLSLINKDSILISNICKDLKINKDDIYDICPLDLSKFNVKINHNFIKFVFMKDGYTKFLRRIDDDKNVIYIFLSVDFLYDANKKNKENQEYFIDSLVYLFRAIFSNNNPNTINSRFSFEIIITSIIANFLEIDKDVIIELFIRDNDDKFDIDRYIAFISNCDSDNFQKYLYYLYNYMEIVNYVKETDSNVSES